MRSASLFRACPPFVNTVSKKKKQKKKGKKKKRENSPKPGGAGQRCLHDVPYVTIKGKRVKNSQFNKPFERAKSKSFNYYIATGDRVMQVLRKMKTRRALE